MSSATDELRRLLDERGVEWRERTELQGEITLWNGWQFFEGTARYNDGYSMLSMVDATPEQAVEATLGSDLKAENAELRKHVKMPDEPLEIDEKDFYARAFIKWAIEEQPEVKRIEAENEKLRELVLDMWCAMWECNQYTCKHGEEGCYTKNGDNGGKCSLRDRMRELGVDTAKEDE